MRWGRKLIFVLLGVACACWASATPSKFGNCTIDPAQNVYGVSYLAGNGTVGIYKISATGAIDWNLSQNPPTGYQYDQTVMPWIRVDSFGNSFVLCQIYSPSAGTRGFEMLKFSPSGTWAGAAIYNPGAQRAQIVGYVLNSAGSPFAVFRYGPSTSAPCSLSGIWMENPKLDASTAQQIYLDSTATPYTLATDVIADGSGNVYVGCNGAESYTASSWGSSLIFQFSSTNEWMWTYIYGLPNGQYHEFYGSLSLDSSNRLTYVEPVCDSTGTIYSLTASQVTLPGPRFQNYWSATYSVHDAAGPIESMVDSNGNIYVLGNQVQGNNYYVTKLSPTGSQLWNENYNNPSSVQGGVYSFAQDVNGTVEVLEPVYINGQGSGTVGIGIQLFNPGTGAPSGSYSYTGGHLDLGYSIFPSPTTSGSFDVIGCGETGGTAVYPLAFQIANDAFSWIWYI